MLSRYLHSGTTKWGRFLRFYNRSAIAQLPLQLCYCRPENLPPSSFWHDLHLVVPVCPRAGIHRLRFWVFSHLKSKQWTPAQLHTGATRVHGFRGSKPYRDDGNDCIRGSHRKPELMGLTIACQYPDCPLLANCLPVLTIACSLLA